ncbi:unnamed protein product, partial [Closterium sp. NIES-54]
SEGLGFESQCVHFGHPSVGGCQRSTGDPRLILGKGYRLVVLGGYGRIDPLLNKPFYPNGLVTGILTDTSAKTHKYLGSARSLGGVYVLDFDIPNCQASSDELVDLVPMDFPYMNVESWQHPDS